MGEPSPTPKTDDLPPVVAIDIDGDGGDDLSIFISAEDMTLACVRARRDKPT